MEPPKYAGSPTGNWPLPPWALAAPKATPPQAAKPAASDGKTKRVFENRDVAMKEPSGKRNQVDTKPHLSMNSMLAAIIQSEDQEKYPFDAARFYAFYPQWFDLAQEMFRLALSIERTLEGDPENQIALSTQHKEKEPQFSEQEKTLLSFHFALFPRVQEPETRRTAFTEVFILNFSKLESLFSQLLPNFVDFIHEKAALVSALATLGKIINQLQPTLLDLHALLESGDENHLALSRQDASLNPNLSLICQFLDLYDGLTPLEKTVCRTTLAAKLDKA